MLIDSLNLLTFRPNGGVLNEYVKVQDIKEVVVEDYIVVTTVDGDTYITDNDSLTELFSQPNDFVQSILDGWESKLVVPVEMLMSDVVASGSEESFRLARDSAAVLVDNNVKFGALEGYDATGASGIKLTFDCHFNFERLIEAPPRLNKLPIFK